MEVRGGVRFRSPTIGIADALIILFVIMLLTGTLTSLVIIKIPRFAAHAEQQLRIAKSHLSLDLLGPVQAVASAPPLMGQDGLPPFPGTDADRFLASLPLWGPIAPSPTQMTASRSSGEERRVRRHSKRRQRSHDVRRADRRRPRPERRMTREESVPSVEPTVVRIEA